MSDFSEHPTDPLDALLTPEYAPASDAFRLGVLARTTASLRRQRRLSILRRVAALAACYVAGLATMYGFRPAPPTHALPAVTAVTPPESSEQDSATALEWKAVDHPDEEAALYRGAGDRYLADENDPKDALRCYSNGLDAGGGDSLAINPSDSWLLIAIKDARQKEKRDASRVD
jgi:hypothetical protein